MTHSPQKRLAGRVGSDCSESDKNVAFNACYACSMVFKMGICRFRLDTTPENKKLHLLCPDCSAGLAESWKAEQSPFDLYSLLIQPASMSAQERC